MSGRAVLTLLLYLWIGITAAMVLMWLFRRRSGSTTTLGAATKPGISADDEPGFHYGTGLDPGPDSSDMVVLGRAGPEPPPSGDVDIAVDGESGAVAETDGRVAGEDIDVHDDFGHGSADDEHEDRHLVASALGVGLSPTATPSIGESVIDLLADIELPYGLEPMDLGNDGRRAVYLSPHSNPEDVGTEFADELVKLGYSIEPMGLDRAVARRGHDVLHMRIVPDAGAVVADDGETKPYGQASTTDTALELWIDPESDIAVRW